MRYFWNVPWYFFINMYEINNKKGKNKLIIKSMETIFILHSSFFDVRFTFASIKMGFLIWWGNVDEMPTPLLRHWYKTSPFLCNFEWNNELKQMCKIISWNCPTLVFSKKGFNIRIGRRHVCNPLRFLWNYICPLDCLI